MKYRFLLIFCAIIAHFSAQKTKVHFILPTSVELPRYFQKDRVLPAKELWAFEREKAMLLLMELGYFTVQLKESSSKEAIIVEVILGEKFEGISVHFDASLLPLLPSVKPDTEGIVNYKHPNAYAAALRGLVAEFHNNGYPFAAVRFNNFQLQEGHLRLDVRIEKGPFMVWHEVQLKGDSTLSAKTVLRMLDVPLDSPFSLQKLEEIDLKLKQQSFIEVIKPAEISFEKEGVVLYIYLKATKSSCFNGALGLQPDPVSQRIGLTGELQLRLMNSLRRAEQLDFNWRSIKPATQWLNVRFSYPYLFNTLLGTELRFHLYKRDSTFLELKSQMGIQYSFSSHWLVKAMYNFSSSNRLYAAGSNAQFPMVASLRNSMYGIGINYRKLDYMPNPRKGFVLNAEGFVGQRKVLSDSNSVSTTAKVAFSLEHFIPLHRRWVFRYQLSFDTYYAPTIYSNECYRFGGLNSQRGFNEENFLSTTKSTNQWEIRYLLDRNSAVFAFYDQSVFENTSGANYKNDRPFGFGVGANIGSKAGIFSLVYGLGTEQKNPLDFRSGKIHFGYIAYF